MKLLVIEDNHSLVESLKHSLGKSFIVETAHNGEEGIHRALTGAHDLIVLDLHLPDKNGYEVCKSLRAAQLNTPILILTAVTDVPSKITVLNAGADDYVTKPFNMSELKARINAVLRRSPVISEAKILEIHDLVIDPGRRQVMRSGKTITLRRKEFDILEYLVRNRGRAVTRAMIVEHAWDTNKETWHNTVDVHIKHLRDKVDRPFKQPLIKTAYGIGYMVIDDV
ncbi:MAG TPA: response regulator transcription factor [Patescibacteria group bacterium]|nr:response regulator transcription factor [Patescibacteria group bacterium]